MGNREENISCIPKTSLTDIKDKSRTKLTSISFLSLRNFALDSLRFYHVDLPRFPGQKQLYLIR